MLWMTLRLTKNKPRSWEREDLVFLSSPLVFILSLFFFFFFNRQLKPDPTPLVTSRYNVFQNDEFDVFSRDSVDVSRIQKGKR